VPLSTPKLVLFDLDGTLLDTAPDLVAAVNATLLEYGAKPRTLAELRPFVGMGGARMLGAALAGTDIDMTARATSLVPRFLGFYARMVGTNIAWFAGIEDVIAALGKRRIAWGVVTNKPHRLAQLTLHNIAALNDCAVLIGAGVAAHAKPAPHPLRMAARQLGVAPSRTWYVGDDHRDMVAARAAGMAAIAAAWGYIPPDTHIDEWQADAVAHTPTDLAMSVELHLSSDSKRYNR
jgi:N-acetyl-D-muramate 6-phosphate phosphatase